MAQKWVKLTSSGLSVTWSNVSTVVNQCLDLNVFDNVVNVYKCKKNSIWSWYIPKWLQQNVVFQNIKMVIFSHSIFTFPFVKNVLWHKQCDIKIIDFFKLCFWKEKCQGSGNSRIWIGSNEKIVLGILLRPLDIPWHNIVTESPLESRYKWNTFKICLIHIHAFLRGAPAGYWVEVWILLQTTV